MVQFLRKPPVTVAACEFRFIAGEPWDPTAPGLYFTEIRDALPNKKSLARFNMHAGGEAATFGVQPLVQFESKDEKSFVQLAPNYLSIHKLAPYSGWPEFRRLVDRAFTAYLKTTSPSGLQRIGLRYINRIEFEGSRVELRDFLNFYPYLESGLPQDLATANASVLFVLADGRDALNLQLAAPVPGEVPNPPGLVAVLDLDYYLNQPGAVSLGPHVFEWLDVAHSHIKSIFLGCLKPSILARFEPALEG